MFNQSSIYEYFVHFLELLKYVESFLLRFINPIIERRAKAQLAEVGIIPNGKNKWDPQVHNKNFYSKSAAMTSLGEGESYMDGWWDCQDLEEFGYRYLRGKYYKTHMSRINMIGYKLIFNLFNLQTKVRCWQVGEKHYDIGNDLFEAMLDSSMNYSCGYWKSAKNLEEAQRNKMELIAQKLKLKPGMRVLDIGCGWGGLCQYLAQNHGVKMVGITISKEGACYADKKCKNLPVDIRLMDYRDLDEKFDRIVSVGMFEHVGESNYRTFFEVSKRCLVDDGILLLHTIGVSNPDMVLADPWTHKYIFPNGVLPYYQHIPKYTEGLFIIEDWHSFGPDYSKTLRAWYDNFIRSWPRFEKEKGERFFRMWTYYLKMASAGFRARRFQLWQVVLTKDGLVGGYESVR